MFVFKLKTGFAVIEIGNPLYRVKGFSIMTLGTVLPELIVMRIDMTVHTAFKWHPRKLLEIFSIPDYNFMTFYTRHIFMLSFQLKFCNGMTELNGRLK